MALRTSLFQLLGLPAPVARLGEAAAALRSARPLFLLGAPRSGTTLLCRLVDSHPSVFLTNENGALVQLSHMVTVMRKRRPAGMAHAIESKEFYEEWADHMDHLAPALATAFYAERIGKARARSLRYWGDKHPHYNASLAHLRRWFPQARYLYIVRHPLDVIRSIAEMNRWAYAEAFEHWKVIIEGYESRVPEIPQGQRYTVRYEDLVAAPRPTLSEIFAWLEIERSEEILRAAEAFLSVPSHAVTRGAPPPEQAKRNPEASVGRWKTAMTAEEARRYLDGTREFLARHYPEQVPDTNTDDGEKDRGPVNA